MEGPHLPFEGKAGWPLHIALKRFSLDTMGSKDARLKYWKRHQAAALERSLDLVDTGGEKVAPFKNSHVQQVIVEVHKRSRKPRATGEQRWNPDTRRLPITAFLTWLQQLCWTAP